MLCCRRSHVGGNVYCRCWECFVLNQIYIQETFIIENIFVEIFCFFFFCWSRLPRYQLLSWQWFQDSKVPQAPSGVNEIQLHFFGFVNLFLFSHSRGTWQYVEGKQGARIVKTTGFNLKPWPSWGKPELGNHRGPVPHVITFLQSQVWGCCNFM